MQNKIPNDNNLAHIHAFISLHIIVSITVFADNEVWPFNAFYVLGKEKNQLFIMTSTKTQHGKILKKNKHVVGTISDQNTVIATLQGLQFSGTLEEITTELESSYKEIYCNKFPIAKNSQEPIWVLTFDKLKFTDNKLGFGTKIYWQDDTK